MTTKVNLTVCIRGYLHKIIMQGSNLRMINKSAHKLKRFMSRSVKELYTGYEAKKKQTGKLLS